MLSFLVFVSQYSFLPAPAFGSCPVSLFLATLTALPQLKENKVTLSPVVATLTSHVKANPFVCRSYKKHPGWESPIVDFFVAQTSVCALLRQSASQRSEAKDPQALKNLAVLSVGSHKSPITAWVLSLPPVTNHPSPITKSFGIRTSEKHTCNPFGMRTSKTQHLNPFRIRTYEKRGVGEGGKFFARGPVKDFYPERPLEARDLSLWHSHSWLCSSTSHESPITDHGSRITGHGTLHATRRRSLKQIRLLPRDALPQRLELEPSHQRRSDLRVRELRRFVGNLARLARRFREQLRLAGAVHGDKPPRRFVHGLPHGQQAVIAQDARLFVPQRLGNAVAFIRLVDHARVIVKHDMIFIKRASILRQRVEQSPQRGPRLAVQRMRMRRRDHIGARFVNPRMNSNAARFTSRSPSTTSP